MYIVDERRKNTMRERLGDAVKLIDDERFLPLFRNRQKQFPEEFAKSVEIAKKKKQASRYFATIWAKKNLRESVNMLRKLINMARADVARLRAHLRAKVPKKHEINADGRAKYEAMRNAVLGGGCSERLVNLRR